MATFIIPWLLGSLVAITPLEYASMEMYDKAREGLEIELKKGNLAIRAELAQAYFSAREFDKVILLLENTSFNHVEGQLLALSLRQKARYDEALKIFEGLPTTVSISFDHALTLFEAKRYSEAKQIFENLSQKNFSKSLARLWQAKISIEENQFSEALDFLDSIQRSDLTDDAWYEWLYTRGDLAFRQRNWSESVAWFEKAMPLRNQELAAWAPKTALLLNQAYLKQIEDPQLSLDRKLVTLERSENLTRQYPQKPLDIARLICAKARLKNDPSAFSAGKAALEAAMKLNPELKVETLLLLGDNIYWEAERLESRSLFEEAYRYFQEAQAVKPAPEIQAKVLMTLNHINIDDALSLIKSIEKEGELTPTIFLLKAQMVSKRDQAAAIELLKTRQLEAPQAESQLWLLGTLLFKEKKYAESEQNLARLIEEYPDSVHLAEALYWAGRAAEVQAGSLERTRDYFYKLYTKFPSSDFAPEAYFYSYTFQEYLLGNRASIKHLHGFKERFPKSPLLLKVLYLEGLDALHDRRSPEGKLISRKNLTLAIDAFQELENLYDTLYIQNKIGEDLSSWTELYYQAKLERAKTNLAIAEESKGAKKEIYLDYAEELFQKIQNDFRVQASLFPFKLIEDESSYFLALTQMERGKLTEANETWKALCEKYLVRGDQTGYYLSKSLYQRGKLASRKENFIQALDLYDQAKIAAADFLSTDEILSLLIERGEVLKESGELDQAMLTLSEAVNYPAISHLRLKAMYLRAKIYSDQGRRHLARKQLESLKLKGGEWGIKAKETLDREFGYD